MNTETTSPQGRPLAWLKLGGRDLKACPLTSGDEVRKLVARLSAK